VAGAGWGESFLGRKERETTSLFISNYTWVRHLRKVTPRWLGDGFGGGEVGGVQGRQRDENPSLEAGRRKSRHWDTGQIFKLRKRGREGDFDFFLRLEVGYSGEGSYRHVNKKRYPRQLGAR